MARPSGVLAFVLLAMAPAFAQDVTIAVGSPFTSMDPHFHNLTTNSALSQHVFDRLLEPDAQMRPQPGLALSWHAVSPTSWEFRLRPDARFQDGTPFTADDVAFTFQRAPGVPGSPSSYGFFTRPVRQVTVLDARTLRLETEGPAPLLPALMQGLPILGRRQSEGMTTADFNAGRAAIGTGPYRLVSFLPGDRAVFRRNADWWGGAVAWNQVTYRVIGQDAARLAALRAGDVDLIDQVPTQDVADLQRDARLALFSIPSLRNIFLSLDGWRERTPFITDHQGRPFAENPLRDPRVRRALSLAIDRGSIVAQVMDGQAVASAQPMPAGSMGHDPTLAPDPHDPDAARRLLAEAGYPQGFTLTLHGPNDRYVNDARILQALAPMWARIGLRVRVESLPSSAYFTRLARGEFSVGLLGWATGTGEADSPLVNALATVDPARGRGAFNIARHSNPAFDALLDRALTSLDATQRETYYREATRLVMRDQAIIPLHHQVNIWAARRGLVFEPRRDELTTAMGLRPLS